MSTETFKCKHPDHVDGVSCQDRSVGCDKYCPCCMENPSPADVSAVEWAKNNTEPTDWGHVLMESKWMKLAQRCDEAERELEREQCRLAACGVVALSDTPESAREARKMHPNYESASCNDVARRVDECITLRAQLSAAQSEATALRISWQNAEATIKQLEERLNEEISHSKAY